MTECLEVRVEIPQLSWLIGNPAFTEDLDARVALTIERLMLEPGVTDIWNLPTTEPVLHGALDLHGAIPVARCQIPLPAPGERALYRLTVLKTGTALDAQGKVVTDKLHPTEEELLFCVLGAAATAPFIPGVQTVVISQPVA